MFPSGTYHYDAHTFFNGSANDECITVIVKANCGGDRLVFGSAYLNEFNPDDLKANYLNDGHYPGMDFRYSFTVPAMTNFVVVVEENTQDMGCDSYILTVEGPVCP